MLFERGPRRGGFRFKIFGEAARELIAAWGVALLIAGAGLALVSFGDVRGSGSVETLRAPHTAGSATRPSGRIGFTCPGQEETAEHASQSSEPHREEC